jgi:hypothetical protein
MASLRVHSEPLTVRTTGKGTYEITEEIRGVVTRSGIAAGTATVFVQHTSFALEIRELHWFALRKISTMGASRSREITGAEVSSSCGLLLIENGLMRLSSETIAHHFAEVPPAPPKLFDLDDWLQGRRVRDACVFGS